MIIAFDVDGTLLDYEDKPRKEIIELLKALDQPENTVVVWSGGGEEYARMVVERLGLEKYVHMTSSKINRHLKVDLAIDDQEVKLGKLNLRV